MKFFNDMLHIITNELKQVKEDPKYQHLVSYRGLVAKE